MNNKFDIFLLLLCSFSVILAFILSSNYRLLLLIISGLSIGFYYGRNNNEIYHVSQYEEKQKKVKPIALIDACWKHITCAVIGSISLYLLASRTTLFTNLNGLSFVDLILFLTTILAYTGFLPLTLTVFAVSGKLIDQLFKN